MDRSALAVFHGHACHPLTRCLRPGFRHCFVAVLTGEYWVELDGKMGTTEIAVVAGRGYDLAAYYQAQGFAVVETVVRNRVTLQPAMLGTCVGVAKRALGLAAPWVVTPYRLFRHLNNRRGLAA